MKEVKYNGRLEDDYIYVSDDEILARARVTNILRILFIIVCALCFGGLLLNGMSVSFSIILTCALSSILYELSIMLERSDNKQLNAAKNRLENLKIQLEENDILVDKLDLSNRVEKCHTDKTFIYENRHELNKKEGQVNYEKYWYFLDNNQKVQILKYVRNSLIGDKCELKNENYFLLEEKDKDLLEEPLKKALKLKK